jgi:hypothetical protein
MDMSRRQGGLVSVDGSRGHAGHVVILAAVLVALALVKPWGDGSPPASTPVLAPDHGRTRDTAVASPVSGVPETPTSTAGADSGPIVPLGPDEISCLHGLELVSLVRLADWNVREWLPIQRSAATGPLDPRLEFAALDGGPVRALGLCNELGAGDQARLARPRILSGWRLTPKSASGTTPIALKELASESSTGSAAVLARVYRPTAASKAGVWPAGRYVFLVAMTEEPANPDTMWIGVEVGPTLTASR